MLVEYFVRRYGRRAGKNFRSIDKKTMDLLQNYDWPGNIRELQNVIERSVILNSDEVFAVDGPGCRNNQLDYDPKLLHPRRPKATPAPNASSSKPHSLHPGVVSLGRQEPRRGLAFRRPRLDIGSKR